MSLDASKRSTGSVTLRALDLLAAFTPSSPLLTLSEISRRSGLPMTTAHRLVADLLNWGALERGEDGKFQVGVRLWETASVAPRGRLLRELALPVMEDFSQITNETVMLGIREGADIVYVERVIGKNSAGDVPRMRGRFPLISSAGGRMLLAFSSPAVKEEVLQLPIRSHTSRTITDLAELRRQLAEIRQAGVAVSDRQTAEDVVAVAGPVFGSDRKSVVAALTVGVPYDRADVHVLTALIRTAARSISRTMEPLPVPRPS